MSTVRIRAWLSRITPQDAFGMVIGVLGGGAAAAAWLINFGATGAAHAADESEQDRRLAALEKEHDAVAGSLKDINANLVKLMVSTGVQPVEGAR